MVSTTLFFLTLRGGRTVWEPIQKYETMLKAQLSLQCRLGERGR